MWHCKLEREQATEWKFSNQNQINQQELAACRTKGVRFLIRRWVFKSYLPHSKCLWEAIQYLLMYNEQVPPCSSCPWNQKIPTRSSPWNQVFPFLCAIINMEAEYHCLCHGPSSGNSHTAAAPSSQKSSVQHRKSMKHTNQKSGITGPEI